MGLTSRIAFWSSAGMLGVSYLGAPALMVLRARRARPVDLPPPVAEPPRVSFVIAVHNEADGIAAKVLNALTVRYPSDRIEVIVASDGSDDGTAAAAATLGESRVRVLDLPRMGKNRALNRACAVASGEILVFSDADSTLEPGALLELTAPFADPGVGCVGGDFRYRELADRGAGEGQSAYWTLERRLRILQTRAGSATAVSGALLALRRELYRPVPDDCVDDFFVMAQALDAGRRVVFQPSAVAKGALAVSLDTEYRRKVRIMTGGLRAVWNMRRLLDPRRHGFTAVQLFLHKVLRRLAVYPAIGLLVSSAVLARRGRGFRVVLAAQLTLHGLAVAGFVKTRRGRRPSRAENLALFYDMTNVAALRATSNVVRGYEHCAAMRMWSPDRAGEDPGREAPAAARG